MGGSPAGSYTGNTFNQMKYGEAGGLQHGTLCRVDRGCLDAALFDWGGLNFGNCVLSPADQAGGCASASAGNWSPSPLVESSGRGILVDASEAVRAVSSAG